MDQLEFSKSRWVSTKFPDLKTRTKVKSVYPLTKKRSHSTANIRTTGITHNLRTSTLCERQQIPLCIVKAYIYISTLLSN